MKTAISVPDETFRLVEQQVAALGITRSEFYARAARRYLDELEQGSLTRHIDAAIEKYGEDDSQQAAVAAGRQVLAEDTW